MSLDNISAKALLKAANIQEKIETLQSELQDILGDLTSSTQPPSGTRTARKKIFSASARRKMAASKKAKRKVSPSVKAKLKAIAKARWAKAKAAGKNAL